MPHSTPEQPPGSDSTYTPAAAGGNSAPDAPQKATSSSSSSSGGSSDADAIIHAYRLGHIPHILHIAITAGFTSVFFMGPLGKGSWHEWKTEHVFALLGMVWYNTSRSNSANANLERFKRIIIHQFPETKWLKMFLRPAETRWMVVMDGATLLDER